MVLEIVWQGHAICAQLDDLNEPGVANLTILGMNVTAEGNPRQDRIESARLAWAGCFCRTGMKGVCVLLRHQRDGFIADDTFISIESK